MAQIRIKTTGQFHLVEPGLGREVGPTPAQVEDTKFWREKIAEGLVEIVPVGEFLTEARKKAKEEKNKMAREVDNKAVS